jgi:hypothetical protein
MKVVYERPTDMDGIVDYIRSLSAKTVLDVEPLVAIWDSDQESLVRGVTGILDRLAAEAASVLEVAFATNSRRHLPAMPERSALHVFYLATAGKPLRTAPYRQLPRPRRGRGRPARHRWGPRLAAWLLVPALSSTHRTGPARPPHHAQPRPPASPAAAHPNGVDPTARTAA